MKVRLQRDGIVFIDKVGGIDHGIGLSWRSCLKHPFRAWQEVQRAFDLARYRESITVKEVPE